MNKERILNIVAFCALMENNDGIIGKSPDYIFEKFNRYCQVSSLEDSHRWGLDSVRQKLLKDWAKKWLDKEIKFTD